MYLGQIVEFGGSEEVVKNPLHPYTKALILSVPDIDPYLWGGTSEFGFDCSGLTQRLYRFAGIELPRNSSWQRDYLEEVKSFSESIPGDLIFFKGHVGIHLGHKIMIHANGKHASVTTLEYDN